MLLRSGRIVTSFTMPAATTAKSCDIYFPSLRKHLTHVRSIAHTTPHHCCDCDREYTSPETLSYHCCDCDEVLRNQRFFQRHFSTKKHLRKVGAPVSSESSRILPHKYNKCSKCDETFLTKKQLKSHMSSHRPARNIPCPTGGGCRKKFAQASGLLNHLESGCCASGITRAKMHQLVFAHDPNRYITSVEAVKMILPSEHISASQTSYLSDVVDFSSDNPPEDHSPPLSPDSEDDILSEWFADDRGLLELTTSASDSDTDSDWSMIRGAVLTPTYSDNASEWSFVSEDIVQVSSNSLLSFHTNPDANSNKDTTSQERRCQLCAPNRKPFGSVRAYQAHVNSAAHAPKIFHCPLSFIPKVDSPDLSKARSFSTLGGLTQHLESGRCEGGLDMYSKAITFVEEQLRLLGLSGFITLST
ncbi:hypothetical protein VTL71DRAFT_14760 [Oculimacula yallundae]|uniref:C2H2-type domain-containing protein n=1 Tax=Oculimacula yallundae TaxID=86028 RepID=A0ABR4CJD9_9HELO